jgi:hypothetical protein
LAGEALGRLTSTISNAGSGVIGTVWRMVRSMSRSKPASSFDTRLTARPVEPARAVRPMRCT